MRVRREATLAKGLVKLGASFTDDFSTAAWSTVKASPQHGKDDNHGGEIYITAMSDPFATFCAWYKGLPQEQSDMIGFACMVYGPKDWFPSEAKPGDTVYMVACLDELAARKNRFIASGVLLFVRGLVDAIFEEKTDSASWTKAAERRRKLAEDVMDPSKGFPGSLEDAEKVIEIANKGLDEFELRAKRWIKVKESWDAIRSNELADKALNLLACFSGLQKRH